VNAFLAFPRTVRGRLVAVSAVSILAAVAVFTGLTIMLVGHQLRSSLDSALRTRAQEAAQLAVSAPALLTDPGALESPVSGREIAVEVLDAHGTILARSLTLGARLLPQDRLVRAARVDGRSGYEDLLIGGRDYRLFVAPIAEAGGPAAGGAVLVASDTTDIHDTISHLGVVLTVSGAAIALIAALIAAGLTRRGLRPLRRLAAGAEEIERTADPARRLPAAGAASDEIAQLTGVLNRMLASLERSRANERRFLADASHELRTPVTTIRGYAELYRLGGLAQRQELDQAMRRTEQEAVRMASLVDDLLLLARLDEGRPLARESVDLGVLGVEAAADARAVAPDRTITAEVAEGVTVEGDEHRLRQVVGNLVGNALVHTPAGTPVSVRVHNGGGSAVVEVHDDGPGMAPEVAAQAFERFSRADASRSRHAGGSGLGLAIVRAIVLSHGGDVALDTGPGEGTTVRVELPRESAGREPVEALAWQ
jgi:signal transduction histidine kinase